MTRRLPEFLRACLGPAASSPARRRSDVDKKIADSQAKTDKKIESVETQVEELQEKQKATDARLEEQSKAIEELGQSAKEALQRAQEAGVLAKGKIVFQQSFTEDRVRFKTSSYRADEGGEGRPRRVRGQA